MRAPAFWWREDGGLPARLLAPAGAVVGAVAARRLRRPPAARIRPPVVCIGNPTVGGSGKTPVALALARALIEDGARPVFLTRGYGGRLSGPVVVAGHGAGEVGDEALLLAAVAPTVVARDRAAGGRLAGGLGDVVVMDDGFQNPGLFKTFSALVIDRAVGVGNARVTPAGPLRAPLAAQAPHADALIVTDAGEGRARSVPAALAGLPCFSVPLVPVAGEALDGPVLAFAGIGRPQKFFAGLERLGATVAARRAFADHHVYTDGEIARLAADAARRGLRLVTTAKDHARLASGSPAAARLAERCTVVDLAARLPAPLLETLRALLRPAAV